MRPQKEWTHLWHDPTLDVGLLQAFYFQHAYPRHSHDYYVVCLIERGYQSFTYHGAKHYTPAGGLILLNPDAVHTGEPADADGFEMRSLYPTTDHMARAVYELTGRHQGLPYFTDVRIDHAWAMAGVLQFHEALQYEASPMERESRFIGLLVELIKHYADIRSPERPPGREHTAVRRARQVIEARYAEGISLTDLAEQVALSPYYLLRVFRAEVGLPPYAYLESVRVRHAQQLIELGRPLTEVALDVGYSSQSHLTRRFKQIIGVTPGQYAQQVSK
jgi:AraC-like DNA-binding protein